MTLSKPLSKKTAKKAKEVYFSLPIKNENISIFDMVKSLDIKSTQIHNYLTFLLNDARIINRVKAERGSVYYYWRKNIKINEFNQIIKKFME